MEHHACRSRHLTLTRSGIRSVGILLEITANVGLQDHLIDVLIRGLLNTDPLRDLLDSFNSLSLDLSTGASTSLALPRLVLRDSLSSVPYTDTLARQQPHLNILDTHHSVTFNRCSATMIRKFWCRSCSCRVHVVLGGFVSRQATHGLPSLTALVYRGYGPGPTSVTLHPSRMMDTSERQPFVVGVVTVVMSSCRERVETRATFQHTLGRERVSRCSVVSRGSCTRVNVVVVTNSSASVASPHRLVHLLLHDLRLISNCLLIVLRAFTLSQIAQSPETDIPSPMFFGTRGLFSSRGRIEDCSFFQMMHGFPSASSSAVLSSPGSMIVTFLSCVTSPCII